MKILVMHTYYGCQTGCCGHTIYVDGVSQGFEWIHPDEGDDYREWAEELVKSEWGAEHVADLDWDNCLVVEE